MRYWYQIESDKRQGCRMKCCYKAKQVDVREIDYHLEQLIATARIILSAAEQDDINNELEESIHLAGSLASIYLSTLLQSYPFNKRREFLIAYIEYITDITKHALLTGDIRRAYED